MTCNCPESGTSGSCPFHDASTRFTVEPQPGRWDTKLGRIVTALEDAAYQRGRAEATAAAEQRLRAAVGACECGHPASEHMGCLVGWEMARSPEPGCDCRLYLDTPPPASPRQGEPVDVERLARAIDAAEVAERNWWSPSGKWLHVHRNELPQFADAILAALSEPAEASEP